MITEAHKELNRLIEAKGKILNNIEEINIILKSSPSEKILNLLNDFYNLKSNYEIKIDKVIRDLDLLYFAKDYTTSKKQ
jgi:hypothetical protein